MNRHEGRTFNQARAEIHERGDGNHAPEQGRYVTDAGPDESERYALYRLCTCVSCDGRGKQDRYSGAALVGVMRCEDCRGEGRTRDLIATCGTPEALGVAIVTLAREGEWEGCPLGILDTLGEPGEKWLVRPWLPSARNVSDAAKTLRRQQDPKTKLGTESEARSLLPKRRTP